MSRPVAEVMDALRRAVRGVPLGAGGAHYVMSVIDYAATELGAGEVFEMIPPEPPPLWVAELEPVADPGVRFRRTTRECWQRLVWSGDEVCWVPLSKARPGGSSPTVFTWHELLSEFGAVRAVAVVPDESS